MAERHRRKHIDHKNSNQILFCLFRERDKNTNAVQFLSSHFLSIKNKNHWLFLPLPSPSIFPGISSPTEISRESIPSTPPPYNEEEPRCRISQEKHDHVHRQLPVLRQKEVFSGVGQRRRHRLPEVSYLVALHVRFPLSLPLPSILTALRLLL